MHLLLNEMKAPILVVSLYSYVSRNFRKYNTPTISIVYVEYTSSSNKNRNKIVATFYFEIYVLMYCLLYYYYHLVNTVLNPTMTLGEKILV